jgi:putative endonuclease
MTPRKPQPVGTRAPSQARVAAFQTGLSAESRAAMLLLAKGFRILTRRYKTPYGEIDIIARKRDLVVFVEVKARPTIDDAAYAVTAQQQRRIIDTAQIWLATHPDYAEHELRFDAIFVAPKSLPRHLPNAFDASH